METHRVLANDNPYHNALIAIAEWGLAGGSVRMAFTRSCSSVHNFTHLGDDKRLAGL
jgi:hypothetical protein